MRRFSKKRGLKRPRKLEKWEMAKHGSKSRRMADKVDRSSSPSSSGDLSEEQLSGVASEEGGTEEEELVVYKEPSMYDNLLKKLGSGSESIADIYNRSQSEGGRSGSEDDLDEGSESLSLSEDEVDGEEGTDYEPDKTDDMVSKLDVPGMDGIIERSEDSASEDEDDPSDLDQEHEMRANGHSALETSTSTSSFNSHLWRKLLEGEVDNLLKRKWKYKWEVPAVRMSNCKWIGTGECMSKDVENNNGYDLKLRLYKHWLDVYETSGGCDFESSMQRFFFSLCNSYRDILHYNKKPFYLKGLEEDSNIMDAYIMHSLNHIFKSRDVVTKNDAKVAKHKEIAQEEILTGEAFLDHGFTRPKVLILLPIASIALRVVKRIIQLTPSAHKVNVEHFDRFSDEFGGGVEEDEDKNELSEKLNNLENLKSQKSSKPSDFQALFGGNNNDHFMIGVKFTRKSIKLFSDFYSSDMIVASPLGLITKIGEAEVEKEKDVDYLSSIEVLIIDHADVIAMQNWSHVNSVVEQLNRIPSKQHGTDVMRIRQWYLDGHAQFYRQTVILGSYLNPDINALFNHHCINFEGKLKVVCEYKGVLPKVLLQVRQIYERFNPDSIVDADDARLEYFSKKVFPKIKDTVQGGIMIFISSYFEFVRVRNFLKSQNASFCLLGEYTKQSDISRARVWFFEGRRKIMLYTERAHFYHRYKIRGIQNLIIYSLPERKEFYPEIVNMLDGSHNMTCTALFSRFDQFRLERIVGTGPAKRMVTSDKGIFVFC